MARYHLPNTNSTPIGGRVLAFSKQTLVKRGFTAADLVTGRRYLEAPTVLQAAALAHVNVTYVHHALKHQAERAAIEGGFTPLWAPPRSESSAVMSAPQPNGGNGHVLPAAPDDAELIGIARLVGGDRWLAAGAA